MTADYGSPEYWRRRHADIDRQIVRDRWFIRGTIGYLVIMELALALSFWIPRLT